MRDVFSIHNQNSRPRGGHLWDSARRNLGEKRGPNKSGRQKQETEGDGEKPELSSYNKVGGGVGQELYLRLLSITGLGGWRRNGKGVLVGKGAGKDPEGEKLKKTRTTNR